MVLLRAVRFEIQKLIIYIWNKEKMPEVWKESIVAPIYKEGDKQTVVIIGAYHFCQLSTQFYRTYYSQV